MFSALFRSLVVGFTVLSGSPSSPYCLSVCLSYFLYVYVCRSACPSVYISVWLYFCLAIFLFVYVSVYIYFCLSLPLSVCLSLVLVNTFVSFHIIRPYLYINLYVCCSACPSVCISVCLLLFVCISVCIYISVCLSVCLSVFGPCEYFCKFSYYYALDFSL